MSLTEIGILIGILVGIWGGILSTFLAILKILEYRKDRPKIKVKIEGTYSQIEPDGDDILISLLITAINDRRRPITLSRAAVLMPRKSKQKYLWCTDLDPDSLELTEGKSHSYYLAGDKFEQADVLPTDKYPACVIDETEKWYWSHNWLYRLLTVGRIK